MSERDNHNNEWLSAFLDEELSPSESSAVRQRLSEDAQANQAIEGWRSLGDALRGLPSRQLQGDFADQVLAAADSDRTNVAPVPQHPSSPTRWSYRRITIAVVTTAAACLLIASAIQFWPQGTSSDTNVTQSDHRNDNQSTGTDQANQFVASKNQAPPVAQFLFVVDVTLTKQGQKERAFEQALTQFGIPFDASIQVNKNLEKSLLDSRFLTKAKIKKQDQEIISDEARLLDLVYVIAPAGKTDAVIPFMKQRQEAFSHIRMDIAQKPEEMRIFEQLRLASRAVLAQNSASKTPTARAQRLVLSQPLPQSWLRRRTMPLATIGLPLVFWPIDNDPAPKVAPAAKANPAPVINKTLTEKYRDFADLEVEALFVVRTASDVGENQEK